MSGPLEICPFQFSVQHEVKTIAKTNLQLRKDPSFAARACHVMSSRAGHQELCQRRCFHLARKEPLYQS
jgi:hypothetical protein